MNVKAIKIFMYIILISTISIILTLLYYPVHGVNVVSEEKKVYLTFDDGPIPGVTEKILDVLKEQNVKATFFVVGKEISEREHILKRIHSEGHSIGLHTYSHKFKKIYCNDHALVDEMLQARKKIKEVINVSPTAVRFPGGSAKHLTLDMLTKLHSNNMKVYDWNVDLYDGRRASISVNKIVKNGKNYKSKYSRIIILAHSNSNNANTIKALPEIIRFYKNLNYEFAPITYDTNEYYYRVKSSSKSLISDDFNDN